jgi:3-oxoacyl-[acyl-carrier protein] reductase
VTTERLTPRVALVTGASRGIGRAIAILLGASGHAVCVNYRSQADAAQEVVETILRSGSQAVAIQADVSRREDVDALFHQVNEALGPVAVLVNNAGITRDTLLLRLSDDDWDCVLDTNLRGAFMCTKAAVRAMLKARWGRVINMSSIVGITGNPGQANCARGCQSKHYGECRRPGLHRDRHHRGSPG